MAWTCVNAAVATTMMVVFIADAVEIARSVEHLLHAQVLHPPVFRLLGVLGNTTQLHEQAPDMQLIVAVPLLCNLGISMEGTHPAWTVHALHLRLLVATNLVLTTLAGEWISVVVSGRLWWVRRTTLCVDGKTMFRVRYNRAIHIVLESGAIHCILVMLLFVTASLKSIEAYTIELSFGSQLINMVPTFTLVYVGLNEAKPQGMEKKGDEYV
ncbi:hypothetical protein B0H12DRAFT_1283788 [Mycena haematopus]|nr:hypothetical protein B0H12DRAFT_1283788 [Mycena haematopus]